MFQGVSAAKDINEKDSTWERVKSSTKGMTDYDAAEAQSNQAPTAPLGTPENPSSAIFTFANLITAGRFVLTAAFLVLFVNHADRNLALTLYAIAAITDFLDGWVARSTQTVSWLGKIMDPIMDRFLLFTGVLGLLARGELPLWIPLFVVGRDVYLFFGSLRLQHYRRRPVDVVFIGKVATALLMTGFCFLLLKQPMIPGLGLVDVDWLPWFNHEPAALGIIFVYVGIICSAITCAIYVRKGYAIKREALEEWAEAEGTQAEEQTA